MSAHLTIIGYHNIEGTNYFRSPAGRGTRGFRAQLRLLRHATHVVPLRPALDALVAGRQLPSRAVAITFDDGYRDALEIAAPLLERHALPATFFLVPAYINRELDPWWERLAAVEANQELLEDHCLALKRMSAADRESAVDAFAGDARIPDLMLSWNQCRELVRRGFDIGSHSYAHAILAREDAIEQRLDALASRKMIESELDIHVDAFAYPNGESEDFSSATIDALAAAGYSHAVTTIPGVNSARSPRFALRRVVISAASGARGLLEGLARTRRWTRDG